MQTSSHGKEIPQKKISKDYPNYLILFCQIRKTTQDLSFRHVFLPESPPKFYRDSGIPLRFNRNDKRMDVM